MSDDVGPEARADVLYTCFHLMQRFFMSFYSDFDRFVVSSTYVASFYAICSHWHSIPSMFRFTMNIFISVQQFAYGSRQYYTEVRFVCSA